MEIAVVDLDGVVFKSPVRETVTDHQFWVNYWQDPEAHAPNREIEVLIRALLSVNVHILFLTSRPASYADDTLNALHRCIWMRPRLCTDVLHHDFHSHRVSLMLKPDDMNDPEWTGSGEWKLDVVENLKVGYQVLFAIDDYKPNADIIRKAIPVLLYEQVRRPSGD